MVCSIQVSKNELMVFANLGGETAIITDLTIASLTETGYEEINPGANEGEPIANNETTLGGGYESRTIAY